MASVVQRAAIQAMRTFTNLSPRELFHENLHRLKSYIQQVQASDLNFDPDLVNNGGEFRNDQEPSSGSASPSGGLIAPVTYLHLYEDHVFTMGIFVLKHGARLPLHDHPGMYGIIKVIHGSATLTSYNEQKDKTVPEEITRHLHPHERRLVKSVVKNQTQIVNQQSPSCLLTPDEGNYHEIHAGEGPLAFLDVLAPPYDHDNASGPRQCHYYKELVFSSNSARSHASDRTFGNRHLGENTNKSYYLIRVPQPHEFWCDTAEYQGPEINPYEQFT